MLAQLKPRSMQLFHHIAPIHVLSRDVNLDAALELIKKRGPTEVPETPTTPPKTQVQ